VHEAIDAQAKGLDYAQALEDYIESERQKQIELYREVTGVAPPHFEFKEFDEQADFARSLAVQYFEHYGEEPLASEGLEYVATEVSFKVPILIEGTKIDFIGTWDGIAQDTHGNVWLVENKTASKRTNLDTLQYGNQYVGYPWAFQEITGEPVKGVLYNGIIKKLIVPPRQLKSGKFSTDKSQSTTAEEYMRAVIAARQDPMEYVDTIEHFDRLGYGRFFHREKLYSTQQQIENWGQNLYYWVYEMIQDPVIYPTIPWDGCASCHFRDLCHAQETGRGVPQAERLYEVGSYGTVETIERVAPDSVSSLEELLDAVS